MAFVFEDVSPSTETPTQQRFQFEEGPTPQPPSSQNILSLLASRTPLMGATPEEVGAPTPGGIPSKFPATMQALEFTGFGLPSIAKAPSVLMELFSRMRRTTPGGPQAAPGVAIPPEPTQLPLPLSEPPILPPAQGRLPFDFPQGPLMSPRMGVPQTGAIAEAAKQSPEALLRQMAANPELRLYRNVIEAVDRGDISLPDVLPVLQREGMTMGQFSNLYKEAIATSGRQLQQLSRIRYMLAKEAAKNPELRILQEAIEKNAPPLTAWDKFRNLYRTVDDKRRALMITQFATTARNIISQTGRYSLEVLDQALQKGMGAQNTNALELTASFFRQLTPKGRNQLMDVLEKDPLTMAKLLNNPTGELSAGKVITRTLNTLNTAQEGFFRRATFDGILRSRLAERGIDVGEALANPGLIPKDIWKEASQKALELTFAAKPDYGFGKSVLKIYQEVPFLTTIQPYPRFWVNALKFQLDYSPLAFIKAANKGLKGEPTIPELSKGLIGTSMLAGGMALRYNESLAGPRWYQIRTGGTDEKGNPRVIDARPYAPFSTYLFLAEAIKQVVRAGSTSVKDGRSLFSALKDGGMSTDDIVQGLIGMNRLAGTGLVFTDVLKEGSMDRKMDLLADFVGQYLSGFTVPARVLKDFVAGTEGGPAATIRETKSDELLGKIVNPTIGNLPQTFLPQNLQLPEATSSLRKTALVMENPIRRQLTGVAVRTLNPVEEEVARLDIAGPRYTPRTGNVELDRLVKDKMGDLVEQNGSDIVRSVAYKMGNDTGRRLLLVQFLQSMRRMALRGAMDEFQKTNPEAYKELRLKRLPEEIEGVMGR